MLISPFALRRAGVALVAAAAGAALAQAPAAADEAAPAPAAANAAEPAGGAEAPISAAPPQLKGSVTLKGRKFYLAEYRVLFEVGGTVTASTRGGYFGGHDYGSTRMTVNYQWPKANLALFQQITDRAYADFLQRLEAAGYRPEPTVAFVAAHGAVYEAGKEGSKPGAEVVEEADLGHGKRRYLVMTPTGTRALERGFIGLGAGNIGKRIEWGGASLEGVSVGLAVNLAAQESSGSGSSIFRRGSSAQASAAMEITAAPKSALLQTHAKTEMVSLAAPVPVPGQFATLREDGGYDTTKDAAVQALNVVGRLAFGLAANNSKRIETVLEVDEPALAQQALQGLAAVNAAMAAALR